MGPNGVVILRPPNWDAFRYVRDRYLTDPELLAELQALFIETAVEQAHRFGLLLPDGPGSLCHPARSATVYGDGTVIRPLYRRRRRSGAPTRRPASRP